MTAVLDGEFWLPAKFLPEETMAIKVNKAVVGGGWRSESDMMVNLPKQEYLYEFGFSSPLESLASTESEEDDFFVELTGRLTMSESRKVLPGDLYLPLEAPKVTGGSPQSILGGIGSWSGRLTNSSNHSPLQGLSPPATPYVAKDETLELIYAAAGQVARLKMNGEDAALNGDWRAVSKPKQNFNQIHLLQNQKGVFYADQMKQNYLAAVRQAKNAAMIYEHHLQNLNRVGRVSSEQLTQAAWPTLQQARVPVKASFQGVPLPRKESAGTGVFIPRRYNTVPAVPPRKTSNAVVPSKVVQALNKSLEEINARSQPQQQPQPQQHFSSNGSSLSQLSYDALMARRQAFQAQQQSTVANAIADDVANRSLEACLPQEWSY
ncbi:unnamed protein product [Rhodiola kirilowii]